MAYARTRTGNHGAATLFGAVLLCVSIFAGQAVAADQAGDKDASVRAPSEFLYFKDDRPAAAADKAAPGKDADIGTFTSPSPLGVQRFLRLDSDAAALDVPTIGVFTARGARGQIGFVLDSDGVSWRNPGQSLRDELSAQEVRIGLYSRFEQQSMAPPGLVLNAMTASQFEERRVAMGMHVGYGGFSLEAGLARESGLLSGDAEGVDLGLIYQERSWRASLQFSGRVQNATERAFIDLRDQFGRSYSIELGASYDLLPGLSVGGGVRHAGYGDRFRLNVGDPISDSLIFMGTAFSF